MDNRPHHRPTPEESKAAENAFDYALDELNLGEALAASTTILVGSIIGDIERERLALLERGLDGVIREVIAAVVSLAATENPDYDDGFRIGLRLITRMSTGSIPAVLAAALGSPQVGKLKELYEALDVPLPEGVTDESLFVAERFNGRDFESAEAFIEYARNGMTDAERESMVGTLRTPGSEDSPLPVQWSDDGVGTLIDTTPIPDTPSAPPAGEDGKSIEDRLREAGIL